MSKHNFAVHLASGSRYNLEDKEGIADGEYIHIFDETKIIEPSPVLEFVLKYPLTNKATFTLTHDDGTGWTGTQFIHAIADAYKSVYSQEKDPGRVPGLLNRGKSNGPFGIWGHDLDDLVLEGAYKDNGIWYPNIGS